MRASAPWRNGVRPATRENGSSGRLTPPRQKDRGEPERGNEREVRGAGSSRNAAAAATRLLFDGRRTFVAAALARALTLARFALAGSLFAAFVLLFVTVGFFAAFVGL